MPNNHLDAEVRTVSNLKEEDMKWCDILHYSRHVMISPKFIAEKAKEYNVKVIVDTDDWWEVGKDHPKYNLWMASNVGPQIRQHMMYADAVTCTSDKLAAIVPNKNVYVLPNTIPFGVGQFREHELPKSDKVRLVYASSAMNYANTFIIAKAMKKLAHLPIEIVVVGYHEGEVYDVIIQNLTANKTIPYRTIEWTGTENYMDGYQGDILIVPSKATEFNAYKSNIKALEAAALNIPAVISRAEPYLGLPLNYFSGENEFVAEVTKLVEDVKYRKESAKRLSDFAKEHYDMDKWSAKRLKVYEDIQRSDRNSR
jgi:hypothetical protein